ncbi:hypothetical protein [Pseudomonas alkylphenolica]|uniref:hypothetical protein n=1 Tax=Pseudomonas alkylphenolica TaxID=237609 RepID=UPI0018D6666A|nr:hypothetical protein [Pseudomonas alkylphenolica]MBH3428916.1 hypothetical protein [Pseudomonas alkylphenolica]
MTSHFEILCTIRSASFNDEAAAELLRELGRLALTPRLARRVNDIVAHLEHDAKALEALYTALSTGEQSLTPREYHN